MFAMQVAEANVKFQWESLTSNLSDEVRLKWWEIIRGHYEEESRSYHTLKHIESMFKHFEEYKPSLQCADTVAYAILFHDLVYNPKAGDNEEKSAELFRKFVREAGIPLDSPLCEGVTELILLTKTHLTDAHKTDGAHGKEDKHYFLDFDMAILGAESSDYEQYAEQIRQEYTFLSTLAYNSLRAKILRSFLQIPNIFATPEFWDKYEHKARQNVLEEIKKLET